MEQLRFHLDNLWRWKAGMPEKEPLPLHSVPDLETLVIDENPDEFEELRQLARNRMIMGAFRYGPIKGQKLNGYDMIAEAHRRLSRYQEDKNLEHLVDAENMICIEFFKARRQGLKINPVDDGVHHERNK